MVSQQSSTVLQLPCRFCFISGEDWHCPCAVDTQTIFLSVCYPELSQAMCSRPLPVPELLSLLLWAGARGSDPGLSRWKNSCLCLCPAWVATPCTSPQSFALCTTSNRFYCPQFFFQHRISDKANICCLCFLLLSSSAQEERSV